MDANEVIESYVTEVAVQLPRKQRDDVAFELRALLNEELQGRAAAAGRAADAAMAMEFLRGFGHPDEVAARYRPTLTIIDPADGHAFLRATFIGLAVIWGLGLFVFLRQPLAPGVEWLSAFGQWWGSTISASLWWPGMLVIGFATGSWLRRSWPQSAEWTPRAGDRIQGGRAAVVLGIVGMLCGMFVLVDPAWLLDVAFGGRAAPAAYQALTYTDAFLHRQAGLLFLLILLNVPLYAALIVKGRWTARLRRLETGLGLATCATMAWVILDGPVMMTAVSDQMAKGIMLMILVAMLIVHGVAWYRSVRPSPDRTPDLRSA